MAHQLQPQKVNDPGFRALVKKEDHLNQSAGLAITQGLIPQYYIDYCYYAPSGLFQATL